LYGFSRRRIEPVGSISLPVSFSSLLNSCTKYITFDVVDMHYPYNTIFDRGLLNTFEVVLHFAYLCLMVLTALGVISIHGSKRDARNIEHGFTPDHRNVNYLLDKKTESCNDTSTTKNIEGFISKPSIEPECETKRVPLDPGVPNKTMMIS
jgi:hypothetical protein